MSEHGHNGARTHFIIHMISVVLIGILGWYLTAGATEKANAREDTLRIERALGEDRARISTMEANFQNMRETQRRIESIVEEIRRNQVQQLQRGGR